MKKQLMLSLFSFLILKLMAQVGVSDSGGQPDPSAMLDVQSTDKGLLLPRLTTVQMDQIGNPATGLLVFNSDSVDLYMFNGSYWLNIRKNSHPIYPSAYFECGWEVTYEGQEYGTVLIGDQCWLSENLNVGTMITGVPADNGLTEKNCYNNNAANCALYGGLYTWNEMMQYTTPGGMVQGICPPGWHIPSEAEWCTMNTFVDESVNCGVYAWTGTDSGYILRSTTGWYSNWNGSDAVGFNGLPAGIRAASGDYFDLTTYAYWWSDEPSAANAWNRRVSCYENKIGQFYNGKDYALSVRCIKD